MNMQEQIDSINRIINDMDRLDEIRKLKDHNNQVKLNQTTMDVSFKRLKKRGYIKADYHIQTRTIVLFDYLIGKEMKSKCTKYAYKYFIQKFHPFVLGIIAAYPVGKCVPEPTVYDM